MQTIIYSLILLISMTSCAFADEVKYEVKDDGVQQTVTITKKVIFDNLTQEIEDFDAQIKVYENLKNQTILQRDAIQKMYDDATAVKEEAVLDQPSELNP